MSDLITKTGMDILTDVQRLFGDEDSVQITSPDVLRWINAAQERVLAKNPILQDSATSDLIAGQTFYNYPMDRIQFVQAIKVNGVPLRPLSYPDAMEYVQRGGQSANTATVPTVWWEWAKNIYMWPIASATITDGVQIDFIAQPQPLTTLAENLATPDRYYNTMVQLVMTMAHMLDENWSAAQFTKNYAMEDLDSLAEQENRSHFATYPTISVRPEDQ